MDTSPDKKFNMKLFLGTITFMVGSIIGYLTFDGIIDQATFAYWCNILF
jgi:hypothetical protein